MSEALEAALAERDDLNIYGPAKRSLFALQMMRDLEDIHAVAAEALTDGPDDKSCDIVYVDRDSGSVVIAQGYESTADKAAAPAGKTSSLHQAVSWLLGSAQQEDVPARLRSAWKELHEALGDGAIEDIAIWFVHNLPESRQVRDELEAAARTAYSLVSSRYSVENLSVTFQEVGKAYLTERYEGSRTPILVTDAFTIETTGSFEEKGENWTALCTSVPAAWLHNAYARYQERLFSANIRGYLGSARSQNNINNGIQESARTTPKQFWAYNNGITALVHQAEAASGGKTVYIRGLAIVNGAQTTGAVGSVEASAVADGRLLARFIKCDDPATVREIIRYNNRQNPTQASDFRSNDRVQARLVDRFSKLGVVGYNGGRRGGAEDVIRRPGENQLSATVAAQALAAYHGRPDTAYHAKGQIWEADDIYSSVFPERTTAEHIVFTYSLLRAVEQQKLEVNAKDGSSLTQDEKELSAWFGLRGSTFLAVAAAGAVSELILGTAVPDRYALRFKGNLAVFEAAEAWRPVVTTVLALAPNQLTEPLVAPGALRNRAVADAAIARFRGLLNTTKAVNTPIYAAFAVRVIQKLD